MKLFNSLKFIFSQATQTADSCYDYCATKMLRISAALSIHSPLDRKKYHKAKVIGLCALSIFSMATLNIEGAIGAGFGVVDEINRLDEIGEKVLSTQPEHNIS